LDVLDVVRAHQFTMARRKGDWEFIEARELEQSKQQLNLDLTRNSAASSSLREAVSRRIASLTSRERQVLQLVVEGNTNKQIASVLRISQRTVETHRAAVMKKIGARSLPELIHLTIAARAARSGRRADMGQRHACGCTTITGGAIFRAGNVLLSPAGHHHIGCHHSATAGPYSRPTQ